MNTYIYSDRTYMAAAKPRYCPAHLPAVGKQTPLDDHTLRTLRVWGDMLTPAERAAQPALVRDLMQPWHVRGPAWQEVVIAIAFNPVARRKNGITPYEASPVKSSEKANVILGTSSKGAR